MLDYEAAMKKKRKKAKHNMNIQKWILSIIFESFGNACLRQWYFIEAANENVDVLSNQHITFILQMYDLFT